MRIVVVTIDGRIFDSAVHALDLTIRPRMFGFGQAVVNALIANFGIGSSLTFKDNRLNQNDAGASAVVYCSADGFQVLHVDGVTARGSQAFIVSTAQIETALAHAVDQSATVEVMSGASVTLLASPDGKLTVVAPDISDASKTYQFTFETSLCG